MLDIRLAAGGFKRSAQVVVLRCTGEVTTQSIPQPFTNRVIPHTLIHLPLVEHLTYIPDDGSCESSEFPTNQSVGMEW